jgi:Icc-related predicted phosphoesterase
MVGAHKVIQIDSLIGIISGDLSTGTTPNEMDILIEKHRDANDEILEELHSPSDQPIVIPNKLLAEANREKELEFKAILQTANKPVFFLMGNDDGLVGGEWNSIDQLQNINQRRIDIGAYNFVGYQYTNPFVGGPFEKTESNQKKDLRRLLKITDTNSILITHGPAYGEIKIASSGAASIQSIGSISLQWFIKKARPKYHLFGHVHYFFGIHGKSINGAYPRFKKFISIDLSSGKCGFIE